MKKVLLTCGLFFTLATGFSQEKVFTFKFSERKLNEIYGILVSVQQAIDASSMPHTEVKSIVAAIDSVKAEISRQYTSQLPNTPASKVPVGDSSAVKTDKIDSKKSKNK